MRIDKYFKLNPNFIGDPDIYLGAKLKIMRLSNKIWAWENSPKIFVKESMTNIAKYLYDLANAGWKLLKKKYENHFVGGYAPEMDETPYLEEHLASWYQYLIGILR